MLTPKQIEQIESVVIGAVRRETDAAMTAQKREVDAKLAESAAKTALMLAGTMKGTQDMDALVASLFNAIKGLVQRSIDARLKEQKAMTFQGGYDPSRSYEPGMVAQKAGGWHVCLAPTNEPPGSSCCWRRIGSDR